MIASKTTPKKTRTMRNAGREATAGTERQSPPSDGAEGDELQINQKWTWCKTPLSLENPPTGWEKKTNCLVQDTWRSDRPEEPGTEIYFGTWVFKGHSKLFSTINMWSLPPDREASPASEHSWVRGSSGRISRAAWWNCASTTGKTRGGA